MNNVNVAVTISEDMCGNKFWHNDAGQYHREDGPAVEIVNGEDCYYINGKRLTRDQHELIRDVYLNSSAS